MSNSLTHHERTTTVFGVDARAFGVVAADNGRILNQKISMGRRLPNGGELQVDMRFDDNCNNGHETFAITATEYDVRRLVQACGCLHDRIAEVFPELSHLIRWHLTSTDGPMHYVDNTVFLAGDRDHWGLRKGEQRQIRNGKTGQLTWVFEPDGVLLDKYRDSDTQPTDTVTYRYVPWMRTGEGKERELNKARSAAVWPDATDGELMIEPDELKAVLLARLPALLAEFEFTMKCIGFVWPTRK